MKTIYFKLKPISELKIGNLIATWSDGLSVFLLDKNNHNIKSINGRFLFDNFNELIFKYEYFLDIYNESNENDYDYKIIDIPNNIDHKKIVKDIGYLMHNYINADGEEGVCNIILDWDKKIIDTDYYLNGDPNDDIFGILIKKNCDIIKHFK